MPGTVPVLCFLLFSVWWGLLPCCVNRKLWTPLHLFWVIPDQFECPFLDFMVIEVCVYFRLFLDVWWTAGFLLFCASLLLAALNVCKWRSETSKVQNYVRESFWASPWEVKHVLNYNSGMAEDFGVRWGWIWTMALGFVQHPANSVLSEPVRETAHLLEACRLLAEDSALHLVRFSQW